MKVKHTSNFVSKMSTPPPMTVLGQKLRELCTITQLFTLICLCLTLLLVYDELKTFLVIKPAAVSSEEKPLKLQNFPQVSVCFDPGFNTTQIAGHGYKSFWRGSSDGNTFIGWSGQDGRTSHSKLLEDLFTVRLNQTYFKHVFYYTNESGYQPAVLAYTKPLHPKGRCIMFSPKPSNVTVIPTKLLLILNKTYQWPNMSDPLKLTIYLSDSENSIQFNPLAFEMEGDHMNFDTEELNKVSYGYEYKARASQFIHVKGDPAFECHEYNNRFTYDKCAKNEIAERFNKVLGCIPPWFADDQRLVCNKVFNLTQNEDKQVKNMFRDAFPFKYDNCKTPCTKTVYDTKFLYRSPTYDPLIVLHFDPVVSVTRSSFSIGAETLVTRLGGSISSGRTLLWALLSTVTGRCRNVEHKMILPNFSNPTNPKDDFYL